MNDILETGGGPPGPTPELLLPAVTAAIQSWKAAQEDTRGAHSALVALSQRAMSAGGVNESATRYEVKMATKVPIHPVTVADSTVRGWWEPLPEAVKQYGHRPRRKKGTLLHPEAQAALDAIPAATTAWRRAEQIEESRRLEAREAVRVAHAAHHSLYGIHQAAGAVKLATLRHWVRGGGADG